MEKKQSVERIRKFVEKFFKKADVDVDSVSVKSSEQEEMVTIDVQSEKSAQILIGQNGENLRAFQYIIRLLIRKNLQEDAHFPFLVDINGYRKQKDQSLFELIDQTVKEVKQEKKIAFLPPMNAYDRRLVHLHLVSEEGVMTESVGEGEDRKVVIKPR